MEGENEVKLHGMWASTFSKRVELALRLKGIPYEYIEEDLSNKSEFLLQYPVHKKIPVLVHNRKPIAESYVILEFIDETWKTSPKLFPEDPYKRAKVRFWASFIQQQVRSQLILLLRVSKNVFYNLSVLLIQLFESISRVVTSDDEAQEKAVKENRKCLRDWECLNR